MKTLHKSIIFSVRNVDFLFDSHPMNLERKVDITKCIFFL